MMDRILVVLMAKQKDRDQMYEESERNHALWFVLHRKDPDQALNHYRAYCYAQDQVEDLTVEITKLIDIGSKLMA